MERSLARQSQLGRALYGQADISGTVVAYSNALRAFLAFDRDHNPSLALRLAQEALAELVDEHPRARSALLFLIAQTHLALGNMASAMHSLHETIRVSETRAIHFIRFNAIYLQANILREQGWLHKSEALCRQTLASFTQGDDLLLPRTVAGMIYVVLGSILLEWNQMDEARKALTFGLEESEELDTIAIRIERLVWLARLELAAGDFPKALAWIEKALQSLAMPEEYFRALRARLFLAQTEGTPSRLSDVDRWLQETGATLETSRVIPSIIPLIHRDVQRLTLGRYLIAQRRLSTQGMPDLQPLLHFLENALQEAEIQGWKTRVIEILLLQALAYQSCGDHNQAITAFTHALVQAEPEKYMRIFLDEGTPALELLKDFLGRMRQKERSAVTPENIRLTTYAQQLLATFAQNQLSTPTSIALAKQELINPLSEREIEVLQCIAAGLSNQEIANKLYIALGTVKRHTVNIFRKLDVEKRTQAIARARELGLL